MQGIYRMFAALLTSKSVLQEYLYRKRKREGFFDTDIPDMSTSEQIEMF